MIWIKLKRTDIEKAVVYTTDVELAKSMEMVKKKKGKFYYKIVGAKGIRRALGLLPKVPTNRGVYMAMMHKYPPASAYIKRMEKVPMDIRKEMEEFMEWNPKTKSFNEEKVYMDGS